ncbi:MAG: S1 RNA-binding domain-containing protein, partial [Flavobacteriales bacterium TMED84]
MAKKSHKPEELSTKSTDEKSIPKIDNEKINDISTKEDEKLETVVDEIRESSNTNIETETIDKINDANETIVEAKKSSDNSESHRSEKDFQFHEEITYTSKEIEDLTKTYLETLPVIEDKQVLNGSVVRINDKVVVVDINFKSDGVINASEFKYNKELKIGDSVEVLVEQQEDSYGQLKVSHRRARILQAWKKVNIALETGEIVNGQIKSRTKGGMIVDVFGIECFLPGSQIDVKPIRDYEEYVGKEMQFKVVKVNESFRNVVVSHKALIEADLVVQTKEIMSKLEKGQVLEGTVKNITSYGVFVDLGGIDGLIHITDLSWGRISHPEEVVNLDEVIKVVILDFDEDKSRIQLGLKQLGSHPWESLDSNLKVGDEIEGKVVVLADYGVFVEIQAGIEALLHVSEMSWSSHLRSAGD